MYRMLVVTAVSASLGCSLQSGFHLGGSSTTSSSSSAGGSPAAGGRSDEAAAWKRFTVKDLALGMAVDKVAGFTCDTRVGEYRHTCARFLDPKCEGRPTYVKPISFASDVPAGQGCTYDSSTGGTYLDRKPTGAPLSAIALVGTDTNAPRAYEIRYTFPKDVLTPDSNVGKALIAKYGKPDSSSAPIQMRWNTPGIDDLFLAAECGGTEGPTGDYCLIQVYDGPFLTSERSIKQAADARHAEQSGPAAPTL